MADSYNQEAIQEILAIATSRHSKNNDFSRSQLFEIAEELGISHEECLLVEQEWELRCKKQNNYQAFDNYRYMKLRHLAIKYLIINTFLASLDLIQDKAITWSLYIIFSWGAILALNAWRTYWMNDEEYEHSFQKHQLKQQIS